MPENNHYIKIYQNINDSLLAVFSNPEKFFLAYKIISNCVFNDEKIPDEIDTFSVAELHFLRGIIQPILINKEKSKINSQNAKGKGRPRLTEDEKSEKKRIKSELKATEKRNESETKAKKSPNTNTNTNPNANINSNVEVEVCLLPPNGSTPPPKKENNRGSYLLDFIFKEMDVPPDERARLSKLDGDAWLDLYPNNFFLYANDTYSGRREWSNKEWQKFLNYWLAKTGANARKRDWLATWRTWLMRADEFNQPKGQKNGTTFL